MGKVSKKVKKKSSDPKKAKAKTPRSSRSTSGDVSIKALSTANAQMWEAKMDTMDKNCREYRDIARKVVDKNELLSSALHQNERDTLDVMTYLKAEAEANDKKIELLNTKLKEQKEQHNKEFEKMAKEYQKQLEDVEKASEEKDNEIDLMKQELIQIKDFRKNKDAMEKELYEIREITFFKEKEHKKAMQKLEQKFFEEKMRMQQDNSHKVDELAQKAHKEAIANLNQATKEVYKENVRLSEAILYHKTEAEKLKEVNTQLIEETKMLKSEKFVNDDLIVEKVKQTKENEESMEELEEKIQLLEKKICELTSDLGDQSIVKPQNNELLSAKEKINKLQSLVDIKAKEMRKIRKLAKSILDQRTEIERFFLDSLSLVKSEIAANRAQYCKDAQTAYQKKMMAAHCGKGPFPKIRTFGKKDFSTNSVLTDLEAAEQFSEMNGVVDIADLTWEQREKVLRLMFAEINGVRGKRHMSVPALDKPHAKLENEKRLMITNKEMYEKTCDTFITQCAIMNPLNQLHPITLPPVASLEPVI